MRVPAAVVMAVRVVVGMTRIVYMIVIMILRIVKSDPALPDQPDA